MFPILTSVSLVLSILEVPYAIYALCAFLGFDFGSRFGFLVNIASGIIHTKLNLTKDGMMIMWTYTIPALASTTFLISQPDPVLSAIGMVVAPIVAIDVSLGIMHILNYLGILEIGYFDD